MSNEFQNPNVKSQNLKLKPIIEVKPGDYVLSLNEATQAIEPHRIKGLLDMGIKPVYKLTTASGRSIKTTANHPYLVKTKEEGRWTRVSELKAGDGIGVPKKESFGDYFLTRKSVSSKTNNLLLKSANELNLSSNRFMAVNSLAVEGGWIFRRMMPQYLYGGYSRILEKCTSLVTNILSVLC